MADVPARRPAIDGEYEKSARRRVSMLTEAVTMGQLRELLGREVMILTRSQIRTIGTLVDARDGAAHVQDAAGVRAIPLETILAVRLRRARTGVAETLANVLVRLAQAEARIDELERRG